MCHAIKELGLDIADLRGQGYDNGANMRGKNIGLQKKIIQKAFFVPCAAHSLNLVVNDAAKVTCQTISFFSLIQELFVFFSGSVYRWDILKKYVKNVVLKSVSETRWESRVNAIKPLRFNFKEITDALSHIENDMLRDLTSKHQANTLLNKIKSFEFLLSVVVWYDIISKVNVASKLLQTKDFDLQAGGLRND